MFPFGSHAYGGRPLVVRTSAGAGTQTGHTATGTGTVDNPPTPIGGTGNGTQSGHTAAGLLSNRRLFEYHLMRSFRVFLGSWFDGALHEVQPGGSILFPVALLSFQQQRITQPLEGLSFAMIITDGRTLTDTQGRSAVFRESRSDVAVDFIIRASVKSPRSDGHTSDSLARNGADMLYGLMVQKRLTLPLSRLGIQEVTPKPPKLIASGTHATRHMRCGMKVNFPLVSA